MNRYLLSTLTLSLLTAFTGAASAQDAAAASKATASAAAPVSGIDLQYIDSSVRAQDDFFSYLNGKWLKTTQIPADRSRWGTFDQLRDNATTELRGIVEAAQKDGAKKPGSEQQKIGDLYASFMDEKHLDTLGLRPLAGEMSRVRGMRNKKAIPVLIAHLNQIGVTTPYAVFVSQDARESTKYAVSIAQSGLGMPDRDYYLDAKLADVKAKYQAHIEKILGLAGDKDAANSAKAIVALETALARIQWTKVENRDPVKRYNKTDIAKLDTVAPGYDWKVGLAAGGIASKVDYVIVNQPSYLAGFDKLVEQTDLATWKAYFEWHVLHAYANYLSKDFVDASFAFYGTTLTGVTEMQPRWKRGVGAVEGSLGEALGKLYVAQYFPPERKERMDALVKNLLAAYKQSIDTLDWMSPETRKEAQAKLAKFTPKIAYPNKWRDYTTLVVAPNDLVGNMMRAANFAYLRQTSKLGRPVDRDEWGMTPQTVNAYYNSTMNEVVFPAAILQPPFFQAQADDAVNYGAIGAVIGHEISHGFDDKGSQADGDGNLRDWWTADDRKNFTVKTDMLVKQYDSFSPVPGYNVNGALTLGENIADNSGLAIAYKAYHLSLGGKPAPVIDGLTGDQRFYMGFGQVWRSKVRDAQQIALIKTDPHSPGQFRANGTVKNQPGFYEAFGVKPGDQMYLAPAQRVLMW
ncbi:MAG TPA: M13-type metalloendopeptidase [Janthinobacterium sp.]|nr:M13-type metalloendopeptidase [Janthinobacterium sp.]